MVEYHVLAANLQVFALRSYRLSHNVFSHFKGQDLLRAVKSHWDRHCALRDTLASLLQALEHDYTCSKYKKPLVLEADRQFRQEAFNAIKEAFAVELRRQFHRRLSGESTTIPLDMLKQCLGLFKRLATCTEDVHLFTEITEICTSADVSSFDSGRSVCRRQSI
eukprot:gb/GECG01007282.1/.p1 GENE.gb/GECG01007282.1/~~gb/GECG01007282.1/.p1  ORF type:complete len:164 (+),score=9.96 gb/GECG01007282.1/:1-492(+)